MATWTLLQVPDQASEYVGKILEDTASVSKTNFEAQSKRIEQVADKANAKTVADIPAQ